MSWYFSPEQAAAAWQATSLGGDRSVTSSEITTALLSSMPESGTEFYQRLRSGRTLEPLTDDRGAARWISSLPDSLVSHLADKEKENQIKTREMDGLIPSESLGKWDRDSRFWRTCQVCLITNTLDRFSGTWPRQGTMWNGECWERPTLEPPTVGKDCGWSVPTPSAVDWKGSGYPRNGRGPNNNLRDWFKFHYKAQYPLVVPVEYLMGWPIGWTDLEPLAMDKFQRWQQQHMRPLAVRSNE